MYIFIYVYIYLYICICTYIYVCIHLCIYILLLLLLYENLLLPLQGQRIPTPREKERQVRGGKKNGKQKAKRPIPTRAIDVLIRDEKQGEDLQPSNLEPFVTSYNYVRYITCKRCKG